MPENIHIEELIIQILNRYYEFARNFEFAQNLNLHEIQILSIKILNLNEILSIKEAKIVKICKQPI
jgi:hypothetical protein